MVVSQQSSILLPLHVLRVDSISVPKNRSTCKNFSHKSTETEERSNFELEQYPTLIYMSQRNRHRTFVCFWKEFI